MEIGFVGLGMMGLPMLENLARADTDDRILAHDRDPARLARLHAHPAWGRTLRGAGAWTSWPAATSSSPCCPTAP